MDRRNKDGKIKMKRKAKMERREKDGKNIRWKAERKIVKRQIRNDIE